MFVVGLLFVACSLFVACGSLFVVCCSFLVDARFFLKKGKCVFSRLLLFWLL